MRKDLDLALRVRADLAQARQALTSLQNNLQGVDSSAKKAGKGLSSASVSTSRLRQDASQLPALLSRIAGLLGVAFSTREIARASEAYAVIRNRLALVTDGSQDLADAQQTVFRIAQESRQPLTATAELYQRIATNADRLGLSAAGLDDVVGTINKTLAISGASGVAAEAALIQLGQAFASGTLRGEELNSVLEQAPALAQAIAEGLGVAVGDLRKLGEQGAITSAALIQALQKSANTVDTRFAKIQATGGQALTVLGNSLVRVIGELDTASGSSTAFANTLTDLSQWLDSGVLTDGVLEAISLWGALFDSIAQGVIGAGGDLDALSATGSDVASFIARAFIEMPVNLRSAIQIATVEVVAYFDRAVAAARYAADTIAAIFTDITQADAERNFNSAIDSSNSARDATIEGILAERDATFQLTAADKARREAERAAAAERQKAREKEIAALRARAKNTPIELGGGAGKDAAVEQQKKDAEALSQLRIQLLKAQGREQEAASAEFEAKYGEMLQRLRAQGNTAGEDIINELLNIERLNARFKAAESEIDRALSAQRAAETSIAVQREAGLITQAEAQRRIVELHQQTNAILEEQRPILDDLAAVEGAIGDQASQSLADLNAQSEQLQHTVSLLESTLRGGIEEGLTDALTGLANGTYTLRDAISSLGETVLNALVQMAAQNLAQSITGALFNDAASAKQAAAATATTTAAGAMSGAAFQWAVVAEQIRSAAMALQIANATGGGSSFATGGYTGDGGKYQVAGVVHKGEGVLSQEDISALGGPAGFYALRSAIRNGYADGGLAGAPSLGGRPSLAEGAVAGANVASNEMSVYVVNFTDPAELDDYLASSKSDRVIINKLSRNSNALRRIVGRQ